MVNSFFRMWLATFWVAPKTGKNYIQDASVGNDPYKFLAKYATLVFIITYATMHEIGFTPRPLPWRQIPAELDRVARASIRFGWEQPSVRLLMLAGFSKRHSMPGDSTPGSLTS